MWYLFDGVRDSEKVHGQQERHLQAKERKQDQTIT